MDEMVTERDNKDSTVPEEKSNGPSPDFMSGMKAVMLKMVKMLKEGSLTSERLMYATCIKQMASSKPRNVSYL